MHGLDQYHPRQHVSISTLKNLARCPRYYFYKQCGLRTPAHPALSFGTAMHAALPMARIHGLEHGMEIFRSVWEPPEVEDPARNLDRARSMIEHYLERRANGPYDLVPPAKAVAREDVSDWEVEFAIPIPGLPIPLIGRVDSMARWLEDRTIWPLEYKTSSEISERFITSFKTDPQILGYAYVIRRLGIDAPGTIVEGIRVSKVRNELMCFPVYVSKHQEEMFERWACFWGNFLLQCERHGTFLQNLGGCSPRPSFGSNGYMCDFMPLCHEVTDWTELASMYERKDPNESIGTLVTTPEHSNGGTSGVGQDLKRDDDRPRPAAD